MKKERWMSVGLSGVALIGLMLSGVFVSQASAYTDAYWVKPTSASNSGTANAVWQTFVATCDSIDSVTYYVGAEATDTTASYLVSITDSATSQEVWSSSRSARGWKYQDMGFGVHKPVVRGKKYYLRMSVSAQYQQTWNYFYDNYNPYPWGRMGTATYGLNDKDLAARVIGRNRLPKTMWTVTWPAFGDQCKDNGRPYLPPQWTGTGHSVYYEAKIESLGTTVAREQVVWGWIENTQGNWDTPMMDSAMWRVANKDQEYLFMLYCTPKWASSCSDSDTAFFNKYYQCYPPRNLTTSDTIDTSATCNYYLKAIKYLYQRYGPGGSFPKPIHWWSLYEEVNTEDFWRLPQRGADTSVTNHIADSIEAKMTLYKRMAEIVHSVVSGDPDHKVIAGGWTGLQGDRRYPDKFLQLGGGAYMDVMSYHPYQFWSAEHKFTPSYFQGDHDSLRAILKYWNQESKATWADEVGWGTWPDTGKLTCSTQKQADIVVQLFNVGIGNVVNPRGELGMVDWYMLHDVTHDTTNKAWDARMGFATHTDSGTTPQNKPSFYAFRQMTGKLKDKHFNRRVPLADTNVYAYEFEETGSGKRTWVVWRSDAITSIESLSVRTPHADSIMITYNGNEPTWPLQISVSGKTAIQTDSVPMYIKEKVTDSLSRPDVIIDSLWVNPTSPRAGEGLRFYARIKNISTTDSLKASITNLVKFQVDGVTKATYQAQRGLGVANSGTDTLTVGYYGNSTNGGEGWDRDWTAKWGDHLIRAWADSSDKYVELREDNNTKYLWKHFQPKVSVVINNDHKYTNHLNNDTLHLVMNESTSPLPDSAKLKHEGGSWIRLGVYGSRDTIVSYSGNGVAYDSVKVFQGSDVATGWDSIIVDAEAPFVDITSPIMNQTVSGLVPFVGWSWDYQDHDSLWEIYVNGSPWCYGNGKVGENPMMGLPDTFGIWDSRTVPNGWRWHQLRSTDAATNLAKDSVKVRVRNNQTNGGDSWVSGFGTFTSPVMNVATDIGGNVYFAETQNSKVRKYSPRKDSLFAFSAKRGNDSTGTSWATAMILKDSITLWIADGYAHAIKKFDRQGNLLLRFGSFGSDTSHFKQPCGIALDHKNRLWVSDRLNHRIQVFDSTGGFLFQFGSQGADSGRFNSPTGITITPNGLVWVSDTRNNQVQVFDSLGHYLKTIKQVDSLGLDTPLGICSDKWGNVFIADAHHNRIVELNPYGQRILDFGGQGDSLWQFRTPVGLASSPGAHYLYVADMGNRRVQKFIVIEEDTTGGGPQAGAVVQVLPLVYELGPAIPNPSKGQTTFRYALPKESRVNMTFYNVAGQVVKEFNQEKQKAGYYSLTWDGRNNQGHKVGPGVYFYRLTAGSWVKTRKLVIIR